MGRKTEPIVIDAIREEVQFSVGEGPMDGKFVRTPVAFHVYASLERVMEDGETRIIRLSHVPPLATTVAPNDSSYNQHQYGLYNQRNSWVVVRTI